MAGRAVTALRLMRNLALVLLAVGGFVALGVSFGHREPHGHVAPRTVCDGDLQRAEAWEAYAERAIDAGERWQAEYDALVTEIAEHFLDEHPDRVIPVEPEEPTS